MNVNLYDHAPHVCYCMYYYWWFLSLIFQVFAFYHVFVKCNPYTLDSHGVGCLVLLLNLALLTVPS